MNAEQQTKQTKKPKQEGFKWGQELLKAKEIIASLNQTIEEQHEMIDTLNDDNDAHRNQLHRTLTENEKLKAQADRTETYKKFLEQENRELKIKNKYLEESITIEKLKVEANKAFMKTQEVDFTTRFEENAELHRVFLRKDMVINGLQDRVNALEDKLKKKI